MTAFTYLEVTDWHRKIADHGKTNGFTVDRCRHPSVTEMVFWLYRDGTQFATIAKDNPNAQWRASMIKAGVPWANRQYLESLEDAVKWVVDLDRRYK